MMSRGGGKNSNKKPARGPAVKYRDYHYDNEGNNENNDDSR